LREVLARNQRNPAARAAEAVLHAVEKLTVKSRTSHDVFERIYRYGAFLCFTPLAVIVLAVLTVLGTRGAIILWGDSGDVTAGFGEHPLLAVLLVKLCFWLTVVSHQVMHALACVHYKRHVREFGFTVLHGYIPTFYVDVTDIFMASRRARIVNALAGPLVHLFLGAIYFWTASIPGPGLLKAFLAASAFLQLQSLLVSLYPFAFIELDGYHILVDLLGAPTLKHESVRFVRESLWTKITSGARWTRQEVAWVAYFALSLLSIVAFVVLIVGVLMHSLRG
jgi:putative peptide zinc metalloprotease protein